jgi:hypothetical protein
MGADSTVYGGDKSQFSGKVGARQLTLIPLKSQINFPDGVL